MRIRKSMGQISIHPWSILDSSTNQKQENSVKWRVAPCMHAMVSVVRHSPLDRDVGGSIPDMGKTQRISKTANFDKFFVSNPFA
jgi:hypothetical protein